MYPDGKSDAASPHLRAEGGVGPAGVTAGNVLKDVILERQTPLQVLGTDVPGSSGMGYNGIVVNASYAAGPNGPAAPSGSSHVAYSDPGVLDPNTDSTHLTSVSGAIERSMITQITITFTGIVDAVDYGSTSGAITLFDRDSHAYVPLTYSSTPTRVGDRSQVVINFLSDAVHHTTYQRSVDGVYALNNDSYELRIAGSTAGASIHAAGNNGLANQTDKVDHFYALYGDIYGQGQVNTADLSWIGNDISLPIVSNPAAPPLVDILNPTGAGLPSGYSGPYYDPAVVYFDTKGQGFVDQTEVNNFEATAMNNYLQPLGL